MARTMSDACNHSSAPWMQAPMQAHHKQGFVPQAALGREPHQLRLDCERQRGPFGAWGRLALLLLGQQRPACGLGGRIGTLHPPLCRGPVVGPAGRVGPREGFCLLGPPGAALAQEAGGPHGAAAAAPAPACRRRSWGVLLRPSTARARHGEPSWCLDNPGCLW